jgi:UDP-2,3-diacylglucosamine pyrophosphatase LpxH
MLIDAATVESVLPGINQARDNNRTLLGTYETGSPIKIAVEHGHRYDFFCNLDPFSNAAIAPGSVLPPGYFFARIAANSFVNQVAKSQATPVRAVALNNKTLQQQAFFLYYYGWKYSLDNVIWVNDNFDEKIFKMNLNGFTGTFSMNDLLPFNDESGNITAKMYADAFSQESWEKRLAYNNVPMMTNVADAVIGSLKTDFIDKQADVQYFKNSHKQDVRIVVFGHTHIPMLKTFTNLNGEACIYANSGTWVDKKVRTESSTAVDQDEQSMDFVVITPREDDKSKIYVGLFQYNHGKHLLVDSQSIK